MAKKHYKHRIITLVHRSVQQEGYRMKYAKYVNTGNEGYLIQFS